MADVYDAHRLVVKRLKLVLEVLSRHHGANCITLLVAVSMGKMKKIFGRESEARKRAQNDVAKTLTSP